MKGPLPLFFQSAFGEQRENVLNSSIVRDDARSHASWTIGRSYESPRLQRDCLPLINSRSPHGSHLAIPSLDPLYSSPVTSKSASPSYDVSRWDESPGPCTMSHAISPPPRPHRRSSLNDHIEATKMSSQRKDSRQATMDSLLTNTGSVSSLQSPRRPSRWYSKNRKLGQPASSSTTLKDAALHSYHKNKKDNSLQIPSMPQRRGSFSKKVSAMALPSPPIWSDSNDAEASRQPRYVAELQDLEEILGKALEHCSLLEYSDDDGSSRVTSSSSSSSMAVA
jgi:hypothetical protein